MRRNGETSLAYQGRRGPLPPILLLVSGFLSNLQYAWEYHRWPASCRGSPPLPPHPDGPPGIRTLRPLPGGAAVRTTLQDLEVVLDEAGSAKATLFGLWDGCATSILFAATHPERVSSLILFSASPVQTSKDDYSFAWDRTRWEEWLGSIRDGWGTRGGSYATPGG